MSALRRDHPRLLLLLITFVGTAAVVVGVLWLKELAVDPAPALGGSCEVPTRVSPTAYLAKATSGAAAEAPDGELAERRDLERVREPVTIRTQLHLATPVAEGAQAINVRVGPFERSDGVELNARQVTADARIASKAWRDVIEVVLCIDPIVAGGNAGEVLRAEAGSYRGSVFIDDRRVNRGTISYTINLKYEHRGLVLLCVVGAGLVGGVVGSLLATGLNWSLSRENLLRALATSVSCVAALYAVYQAQYGKDPSWLGNDAMFTTLAATCVGAAYAATNFAGTVNIGQAVPKPETGPVRPTAEQFRATAGL
jgi:hypothetical protein